MTAVLTARLAHAVATTAVVCLTLLPALAVEQELPVDYRLNEQIIMVPLGAANGQALQTTVFRPNGPGPFPLLVVNHGKELGQPRDQGRDRFLFLARAFVKRGYAVMVPMRQGFAGSGGHYIDHGCDMRANGYAHAADVLTAIDYARTLDWIDSDRIVVAGQSYGGMATLALGANRVSGVRGLINFAGGLRDDRDQCDWRSQLVKAFGDFGAANKIDSLWVYGVNDSLFEPELVTRMHDAFVQAGGTARLVRYGVFKHDAHGMVASRDGEKVWWNETERFLQKIGMPTAVRYTVTDAPTLARTDFAALDDIDAVPFLTENGREAYRDYLRKVTPRAFAVSPSGAWCWAEEGEAPEARALATCASKSKQPCRLYSVDDYVVWQPDGAAPATANATGPAPATTGASGTSSGAASGASL